MMRLFTAFRAVVFASGFVYLWWWVALRVRPFDGQFALALPAWVSAPGVALMSLGGSLAALCIGVFVVRGHGTPALFDAPRKFVATGPYRYVRNPMYLGGFAVLAGFGLVLKSGSVALFALVWLGLVHLFVVLFEEPALKLRFGAPYEAYCSAVPRWVPTFRSKKR